MQEFKDRLKMARKNAKVTQAQLAKLVGTTQGSISDLESGRNRTTTNLVAIAGILNVNPTWLSTGKGEMTISHANVEKVSPKNIRFAPVLNWVQAGAFAPMGDNDNDYDKYMPHTYTKGDNIYWLQVRGDSMEPDFRQADYLLVDADKPPKAGSFVIAMVADDTEATFKRYKPCGFDDTGQEYCQLVPLNDFHPVIDSRHKPFTVVGVVVEHKRRIG